MKFYKYASWVNTGKALLKGRLLQRLWNIGVMKSVMKVARRVMK